MEEVPQVSTGFSAHDRKLTVPEEVIVYLNQLNAANMIVESRVEPFNPTTRFVDGKYCFMDGEKVIMSADWHLIGEFRILGFDENKIPNDIEFVWGWCVRPDDPHTVEVVKVAEGLDYGMQPLTFPLVKFEDIGILEIIKAFSFNILGLEYITQKFSTQLSSYGIFGLYNLQWEETRAPLAPEWIYILDIVKGMVATRMETAGTAEPALTRKEVINAVWQTPEVLSLVADYRRKKDAMVEAKMEFVNKFKAALADPESLDHVDTPVASAEQPADQTSDALKSVQKALAAVEETELAKLESVGDDL